MSNVPSNTNVSPVWPGPSLLIPMTVDCLLVGEADRIGALWAQTGNNYYNMWYRLLPDTPPPLTPKQPANAPLAGAHLMWTLPYALRHGQQQQEGENAGGVDFPAVPNRWLVLRTQYGSNGEQPTLTAWVIQSDKLTPITGAATPYNQYPDPNDAAQPVKLIGSFSLLADWKGETSTNAPTVQAVGPGDVSWGVAYDNIKNVFGFYDNLPSQKLTVSYCVIGWYDTPSKDPLFLMPTDSAANWQTQAESQFQWSVGESAQDIQNAQDAWAAWQKAHGLGGDPTPIQELPPQLRQAMQNWLAWQTAHGESAAQPPLPRQMLCHGLITNVVWNGPSGSYGSGAPGGGIEYPHISIGNTATEAIAAWFSDFVVNKYGGDPNTIPVIERAVEAFQKNALSVLENDPVAAESILHRARFDATFRGKEWIVTRPESAEGTVGPYGGQQTVPLDAAQTLTLINLNAKQTEFDQTTALLFTQRLELFKLYYKSQSMPRRPPADIKAKVTQALTALQGDGANLQGAIQASQQKLGQLQGAINQLSQSLTEQVGNAYQVLLVDKPSCYAPTDPVVMVAGAQYDTKFAAPGTYSDDETLFTRFTGQTVTGLKIDTGDGNPSAVLVASDLLGSVTLPLGQPIPKEALDLWLEALWIDPSIATLLATLYYKKIDKQGDVAALAQQIAAQQRAIYNNAGALGVTVQTLGKIAQLQGTPPAVNALQYRTGQPWTPIYMDWKVKWFPSYTATNRSLSDWELDDIDYSWMGTNVPQPPGLMKEFFGRTVLNPKIARDLSTQLSQFKDDPDYKDLPVFVRTSLEELAQEIVTFDILTQSLSGFTEQLTTQLMTPSKSPEIAQTANLLGNDSVSFRPIAGNVTDTTSQPFFPIRAGHLQLIDLWVVDCFGQVLPGKNNQLGSETPIPNVVRAESVVTPGTQNSAYVQLPPRIAQPAYVDLRLLQADNDQILSNSSDMTNPICGWVMPNHLDDSMMVFDASGQNLGAVIKVQTDITASNPEGAGLRWDAVPGTEAPLGAPPNLPNSHLQAFINGLLQRGWVSGGKALTELLQTIDTSLWTITPLGGQEGNLSVLLGRALAVVRADLSLNLNGLPFYDQSWMNTGEFYLKDGQYYPTNPPFNAVEFAVRVGDLAYTTNGVIGYFLDDQYDTFYAVYGSEGQTAGLVESLRQPSSPSISSMNIMSMSKSAASGAYVQNYSPIMKTSDGMKSYLTILMDPRGVIPVITGSLPEVQLALAPGPVTAALGNMEATFRVGPLLTDPSRIRMPIPAEIKGQWGWLARTDVTTWGDESSVNSQDPIARLETSPLRLSEGWLTLSGAETDDKS
ncbi:MAG TPA: hypothetical protein VGC66_23255 [Pyrinomonadaceae bacterium]